MRSRKDDGGLSALAVVVAVFLVSATAAAVFNHEGNAGAKVAVAASRFDRQVDDKRVHRHQGADTRAEKPGGSVARVVRQRVDQRQQLGVQIRIAQRFRRRLPIQAMPKNGGANGEVDNVSNDRRNSIYGINPGASNAPESADEKDDQDAAGVADQIVPPTLTFNGRAREIQGDKVLIQRQEAMDRIVNNWTPRYAAARRKYQEPVERISDTRALWSERREEQITLIERQGNAKLGDSMHLLLIDDRRHQGLRPLAPSGVRCGAKVGASAVENRGPEHVHPVRQEPVRVRGDNGVRHLDVPLQAGLLLESLDAFEAEIAGRAEAMQSS